MRIFLVVIRTVRFGAVLSKAKSYQVSGTGLVRLAETAPHSTKKTHHDEKPS